MPTYSRPILAPLRYVLFMPWRGLYMRALPTEQSAVRATSDSAQACCLPDPEARAAGRQVIRAIGEPIELRPVDLH